MGLGLELELRPVTFRTSDHSDQWTFGLVTSNRPKLQYWLQIFLLTYFICYLCRYWTYRMCFSCTRKTWKHSTPSSACTGIHRPCTFRWVPVLRLTTYRVCNEKILIYRLNCPVIYIPPITRENQNHSGLQCKVAYWPALAVGSAAQFSTAICLNERTLDPQSTASPSQMQWCTTPFTPQCSPETAHYF